jgi:hypothetical protein
VRIPESIRFSLSACSACSSWLGAAAIAVGLTACSRTTPPSGEPAHAAAKADAAAAAPAPPSTGAAAAIPPGASSCTKDGGPPCFRFATTEDAFKWVLGHDPLVLGIGEAHAQKGSEGIASSTKRFTETLLPIAAPRSSDVVVELWAPDPKCAKEVKRVASAQKPVTEAQASTNQNEYVTLGTKAKEAGMTPWLLRPTCDDFAMLADAGDDAVGAMLGLVKRLTQAKVTQLYERNGKAPPPQKLVIAYGGALHNDLSPSEAMKDYSFGPELDRLTGGRYVELDLIVPEYVKKSPTWEKLPWFASFEADKASDAPRNEATLYVMGERSFVLLFPWSTKP